METSAEVSLTLRMRSGYASTPMKALRRTVSGFLLCVLVPACGGSPGSSSVGTSLPKASYDASAITTADEFGTPHRINAKGQVLTNGPTHHLAIIDLFALTVTPVSATGRPIGFNDQGEVLYQEIGPYLFRHVEGSVESLPLQLPGYGEFTPFGLGPDGAIWGKMYKEVSGQMAIPGFGMYRHGVVSSFRAWGTREGYGTPLNAVNGAGQAYFCKYQDGSTIDGNGVPFETCFISQPDGTETDLNPLFGNDVFRASPIALNERGELGGRVDYGMNGLGGSRAFLYEQSGMPRLLGTTGANVLALGDNGDVVYAQPGAHLQIVVRTVKGNESDLADYLRPPGSEADPYASDVLGIGPAGQILIRQPVPGSAAVNAVLLTPR